MNYRLSIWIIAKQGDLIAARPFKPMKTRCVWDDSVIYDGARSDKPYYDNLMEKAIDEIEDFLEKREDRYYELFVKEMERTGITFRHFDCQPTCEDKEVVITAYIDKVEE